MYNYNNNQYKENSTTNNSGGLLSSLPSIKVLGIILIIVIIIFAVIMYLKNNAAYTGDSSIVVSEINVPGDELEMKLSSTFDLMGVISFTPQNGSVDKIEFINSNTSVIKIDENGKIDSLSLGESEVIIIVNGSIRKSIKVKVTDTIEENGFVSGERSSQGSNNQHNSNPPEIIFDQPEIDQTSNFLEIYLGDEYLLIPKIYDGCIVFTVTFINGIIFPIIDINVFCSTN